MSPTSTPTLAPGTQALCDPRYTMLDLKAKRQPNMNIPCEVIKTSRHYTNVMILDERKPNGKRDFTNTDTYDCLACVLNCAITPKEATV